MQYEGNFKFFKYVYVTELAGIDTGEKCLGDHKKPWAVGCAYRVTLGKMGAGWEKAVKTGDWRQDPRVVHFGVWRRVKRLVGRFKVRGKLDYNTPTAIVAVRGTTFTIDVAGDGTTLVAVLEGEVEVIDKLFNSVIINEGQQITVAPQKPFAKPQKVDKNLLDELIKWKQNIISEKDIEELEMPKGTVIELPKGRLNYTSSINEKGG